MAFQSLYEIVKINEFSNNFFLLKDVLQYEKYIASDTFVQCYNFRYV